MLHYEKLDVYQVSIQFVAVAVVLSGQLPRGYAPLADQLRRAAWSIPLNIAEGVGKPSPSDQARFHAIARGSAMECGAILDVARVLQVSSPQELMSAKQLIVRDVDQVVPVGGRHEGRPRSRSRSNPDFSAFFAPRVVQRAPTHA